MILVQTGLFTKSMHEREVHMQSKFITKTIRACVLEIINDEPNLICAREISIRAGITYDQTIFALHALHNDEKIYRQGKKTTAMWGRKELKPHEDLGFQMLQTVFHKIVKKDAQ